MAVYIDADDVRQYLPQGRGFSTESIDETMEEWEYYVQTRLKLDQLPPNHPTLKNVIRDLTISSVITAMSPANVDNLTRADIQKREGLRKLRELEEGGLGVIGGGATRTDPLKDIYNPYDEPFFSAKDFV